MKSTRTKPGRAAKQPESIAGSNGASDDHEFDSSTDARLTFDRTGVVQRINPLAAALFDRLPLSILGRPFGRFIARHDAGVFLHHLLRCRSREKRVDSLLHLKSGSGEKIPVRLSSVAVTPSADSVRFSYQTKIIDLRG